MSESKSYLLETRDMCNAELFLILQKHIYQGIRHYWSQSKKSVPHGQVYSDFQKRLRQIKHWSQEVIDKEYDRLLQDTECDYFEDLIRNVIVLNTQIIAFDLHTSTPIKVSVPKGGKFLHRCYTNCGRAFFESVWLMDDRSEFMPLLEQAKNLNKSYKLIQSCVDNTIRSFLPFRSVLKQRLSSEVRGAVSSTQNHTVNNLSSYPHPHYPNVHISDTTSSLQQPSYLEAIPQQRLPDLDTSSSAPALDSSSRQHPFTSDYPRLDNLLNSPDLPQADDTYQRCVNHQMKDTGIYHDHVSTTNNNRTLSEFGNDFDRGLDHNMFADLHNRNQMDEEPHSLPAHTYNNLQSNEPFIGNNNEPNVNEQITHDDMPHVNDRQGFTIRLDPDSEKEDADDSVVASDRLSDHQKLEKVILYEPNTKHAANGPKKTLQRTPSIHSDDNNVTAARPTLEDDDMLPFNGFKSDQRLDLDIVPVDDANFNVGHDTNDNPVPLPQAVDMYKMNDNRKDVHRPDLDQGIEENTLANLDQVYPLEHDELRKRFDNMNFFD